MQVMQGGTASADFRLVPINGFTGTAAVTVQKTFNGLAVPALSTVLSGGAVTVNISASSAPGTYIMIVRFTSGTMVHEQSVTVSVTPAPTPARHRAAK
jgi:hypothetical protein